MPDSSFAVMEVPQRLARLRAAIDEAGVEALLVTNLVNIRYLTGFSGSAAMLYVGADNAIFTTDGRYGIQSQQQLEAAGVDAEIVVGGLLKQRDALVSAVSANAKLGLEAGSVTWAQQRSFASKWFSAELQPTSEMVEELRRVKDQGEIDRIAEACRIADDALGNTKSMLLDGPTELEFALALDFEMRRLGADDISFATIVASGPNGAKAHHEPSERRIERGELIVIDFGSTVDGYHSDMTRTFCVDEPASDTLRKMVATVEESQAAGVAAVRAGVTCGAVDKVCRDLIDSVGWGEAFSHSTGHGVGLDIHEAPAVASMVGDTLVANQVVTVEPGVYLADHGGVRIEDTVVVTEGGCYTLTNAPKDLIVA